MYGDLNGQGDCKVPQTIAQNGGQYTCTFPGEVKGDAGSTHTDTVTAVATDDDGSEVSDVGEGDGHRPRREADGDRGQVGFAVRRCPNPAEPPRSP